MSRNKESLLAGIYAAASISAMSEITNPYDGFPEVRYNGNKQPARKPQLTKKQRKSRAASKRAKKARKRGR